VSAGPGNAIGEPQAGSLQIASSAVVVGTAFMGEGSLLAEGAVIRSFGAGVDIGAGSAVLENSVCVGNDTIPTLVGLRTVFGHRCLVIGATVGDLCEIGNASILMPGARIGDRVFLGEGTLVPPGMTLPSDVVAVGRPARVVRTASDDDHRRLLALRGGDLSLPPRAPIIVEPTEGTIAMGNLYAFRGTVPTVGPGAMIHGCRIGTGSIVEPGAIVCDGSVVGAGSVVRAGAVVKQRSHFAVHQAGMHGCRRRAGRHALVVPRHRRAIVHAD
jgi:carbonic anhydrase/acetyltransferase-like protein (isoleucine patch superfamily)